MSQGAGRCRGGRFAAATRGHRPSGVVVIPGENECSRGESQRGPSIGSSIGSPHPTSAASYGVVHRMGRIPYQTAVARA